MKGRGKEGRKEGRKLASHSTVTLALHPSIDNDEGIEHASKQGAKEEPIT